MTHDRDALGAEPRAARYAVIFKTHFWDDFVHRQLDAVKAACTGGDVWVFVDETHGPVRDIPYDKVFRATEQDAYALGLPKQPRGNLYWYNNDYPMLVFHNAHGTYDHLVVLEFDARVCGSIDAMVSDAAAAGVDLVSWAIPGPIETWPWIGTMAGIRPPAETLKHLFCVALFSRRAVSQLLASRLALAERYERGELKTWPFCEAFIPTELHAAGCTLRDLRDVFSTEHYDWWPPCHEDDLPEPESRQVVHPVLTGLHYVQSLIRHSDAEAYLRSTPATLRRRWDREPAGVVVPAVLQAFRKGGRADALLALRQVLADRGVPGHDAAIRQALASLVSDGQANNLALGKRCDQSSTCRYSRASYPAEDAAHAVSGRVTGDYGFHTAAEIAPWWVVDLGRPCLISRIAVHNRLTGGPSVSARANGLSVWSSSNGRSWDLLHRHDGTTPFGGADGRPLIVSGEAGFPARFVRLEGEGRTMLHLDEVEVFGRTLATD